MEVAVLHRGKLAKHPRVLGVRALTREDLLTLRDAPRAVPRTKVFRQSHHRLARLDAMGWSVEDILRVTGYSYTRLCTLRQDPAYQELRAKFQTKIEDRHVDMHVEAEREAREVAGELIIRGLHHYVGHFDKADEAGELVSAQTLTKIIPDLMDRYGQGKRSTQTTVKVNAAQIMEDALNRSNRGTVIDGRAVHPTLPSPPEADSSSPLASGEPTTDVVGIRRRR